MPSPRVTRFIFSRYYPFVVLTVIAFGMVLFFPPTIVVASIGLMFLVAWLENIFFPPPIEYRTPLLALLCWCFLLMASVLVGAYAPRFL